MSGTHPVFTAVRGCFFVLLLSLIARAPAIEDISDAVAIERMKTAMQENTAGYPGASRCRSMVLSPRAGATWTATYLLVEWQTCPQDDGDVAQVVLKVDGQEMFKGEPGRGRFTMFGVRDGPHVVEVVALSDGGGHVDLGPAMVSTFSARVGASLLGTMAERVKRLEGDGVSGVLEGAADGPVECSKDFTLVTAALDIGRRHGNLTFRQDYLGNLVHLLSLRCPIVVFIQEEYAEDLRPYLHSEARLEPRNKDHLRSFKHIRAVEALRQSPAWPGFHKTYNPAKMELYNALVLSKLYWLADVAQEDPFATPHFLWIDAGLCVRFVTPPVDFGSVRPHMDRFLVYSMHYGYEDGFDVHGFPAEGHVRFAGHVSYRLLRGNIFGGKKEVVLAALSEFDKALEETLAEGYMGTEESAMTVACTRRDALCQVESVSENHLRTEMPCGMFQLLSSTAPRVRLLFPPPHAVVNPEGFLAVAAVDNFNPEKDGAVCFTWAADGGGRVCGAQTAAFLVDLPPGPVDLRAELLGLDGLPIASTSLPSEVRVEPAASNSMDWDSLVLDSSVDLWAAAEEVAGAGAAVVGQECWGRAEESAALAGYPHRLRKLPWAPPCAAQSSHDATCSRHAVHEREGAAGEAGEERGEGEEGEEGGLGLVLLCAPAAVGAAELHDALHLWFERLLPGGILAGPDFFSVTAPSGAVLHPVPQVTQAFAEAKGRPLQVTQEILRRWWFLTQP